MAKAKKKYLVFSDGREMEIKGERGRFWLVEGAQWRKSNPAIVKVKEIAETKKTAPAPSDEATEEKED